MCEAAEHHVKCRQKVCLICQDVKKLMFIIREDSKDHQLVRLFVIENYTTLDNRMPNALCSSCRGKLMKFQNGDFSPLLPQLPDWEEMNSFRLPRCPSCKTSCKCFLCSTFSRSCRRGYRKSLTKLPVRIN